MATGHLKLLEKISCGDRDTLKDIYVSCYPMIEKYVIKNNGTEDEAKDVFQESVMVLYRNAGKPDFQLKSKVGTYLYAVGRQLWLKQLAMKRQRAQTGATSEEAMMFDRDEGAVEQSKKMALIRHCLELLGEPCSTLLLAYYYRNLSMAEIANEMGYTNAENAKNQKYKCFKRLKKLVMLNRKAIENE